MKKRLIWLMIFGITMLAGCQDNLTEPAKQTVEPILGENKTPESKAPKPSPPAPPLREDFEGKPVLSLFPRVGDFQPDTDDERHPYWLTFIEHAQKVAGLVHSQEPDNNAWSFRSVNTVDSLGFFSPVAVKPLTNYTVTFRILSGLPDEANAGIGILEFNEFLWVGEQYTESLYKQHFRGGQEGIKIVGKTEDWQEESFQFTTGPETRMVHLVLFREGEHSRNGVMFDDIAIEPLEQ
mgnify:CR=1 FL=1